MKPSTWSRIRAPVQRRSVNAPIPATPKAKIAPMTRAVSSVSFHGHTCIAVFGIRNRNTVLATARTPMAPMSMAGAGEISTSPAFGSDSSLWFRNHTPKTRKGVVKYRPAHNQKATLEWMNLFQCRIVATPIRDANMPTETKPPSTRCHWVAREARRKK